MRADSGFWRCSPGSASDAWNGWPHRGEAARAKPRNRARRLLTKLDYPTDQEQKAIDSLIKQRETFANEWEPASRN